MATAMELIMTGDPLPAQRAFELGMVNKVVLPEEVVGEAKKLGWPSEVIHFEESGEPQRCR